jgi:hypothetical protein
MVEVLENLRKKSNYYHPDFYLHVQEKNVRKKIVLHPTFFSFSTIRKYDLY